MSPTNGTLKKRVVRKDVDKRKQKLQKELFDKVGASDEYKEAVKRAHNQLSQELEVVKGGSKYEVDFCLSLQVKSIIEAGMFEIWRHISDDKEELGHLRETVAKHEELLFKMQKRALQEISALRERVRHIPEDVKDQINTVEFYDALSYIEPNKRHLMECIIKEQLKQIIGSAKNTNVDEDEIKYLRQTVTELRKELAEKEESYEKERFFAARVREKCFEVEQELEKVCEEYRDFKDTTSQTIIDLRQDVTSPTRRIDVDTPEHCPREVKKVLYNPATKKYVTWCTVSQDECAAMGEQPFSHTSDLTDTAYGDLSKIDTDRQYVAFGAERDNMQEATHDAEKMDFLVHQMRSSDQGCSIGEKLWAIVRQMKETEEGKLKLKYEGRKSTKDSTSKDSTEMEEDARFEEGSEAPQVLEEMKPSAPTLTDEEKKEFLTAISTLKSKVVSLEDDKKKLLAEKQIQVNAHATTAQALETIQKKMEEVRAIHEEEIKALKEDESNLAASNPDDALLAERKKHAKSAEIAKEKFEALMQKFNEMETDLKERSAKWERHTAELKSQLKIEKDLANENAQVNENIRKKLAGVEKKYREAQTEVDKLQLQLGELQLKLGAMKDEFVKKLGDASNFEDLLESVGLKDFAEGGKRRKVFDRLYDDALRRLRRLEELSFKIHEKERIAIARVMDSRISNSNYFLRRQHNEKKRMHPAYEKKILLDTAYGEDSWFSDPQMLWEDEGSLSSLSLSPRVGRNRVEKKKYPRRRGSPKKRNNRSRSRKLPESPHKRYLVSRGKETGMESLEPGAYPKFPSTNLPSVYSRSRSKKMTHSNGVRGGDTPRRPSTGSLDDNDVASHPGKNPVLAGGKSDASCKASILYGSESLPSESFPILLPAANKILFCPPNLLQSKTDLDVRLDRERVRDYRNNAFYKTTGHF